MALQPLSHSPTSYYILLHLYLICPKHTLHSLLSTISLLLLALIFISLFLHTSTNHSTIALRSSFDSPHRTKSSVHTSPGNFYSLPFSRNLAPLLPNLIFTSFITPSMDIYIEQPRRHDAPLFHPTIYPKPLTFTPLLL